MKGIIGALALLVLGATTSAQTIGTTTFTQTAAGPNCHVIGCINAPLSDGETFTWSDTIKYYGSYNILGALTFRGVNYHDLVGKSSGYEVIDLSNAAGFAIHEEFTVRCYRSCANYWLRGTLTVPNEFVGVQVDRSMFGPGQYPDWPPTSFGGQVYQNGQYVEGPTTGTVQVNLAVASTVDTVVTLSSSDPTFTVPTQLTIPAGALSASGTINAAVIPYGQPRVVATISATYPDGGVATIVVTDDPGPAPPNPDE